MNNTNSRCHLMYHSDPDSDKSSIPRQGDCCAQDREHLSNTGCQTTLRRILAIGMQPTYLSNQRRKPTPKFSLGAIYIQVFHTRSQAGRHPYHRETGDPRQSKSHIKAPQKAKIADKRFFNLKAAYQEKPASEHHKETLSTHRIRH